MTIITHQLVQKTREVETIVCKLKILGPLVFGNELIGADDPEKYHGIPVGLQIVGRRLQEEKVVAIAEMFENAAKMKDL